MNATTTAPAGTISTEPTKTAAISGQIGAAKDAVTQNVGPLAGKAKQFAKDRPFATAALAGVLGLAFINTLRGRFASQPSPTDLAGALRQINPLIASHGSFNYMLSDGNALYAHCSTRLHYIVRQHPFADAKLSDEDMSVNFADVTTPRDRLAVIVTEPLTANETWIPFASGELKVFVGGTPITPA